MSDTLPDQLFYYTSKADLSEIIQTKSLQLTDYNYIRCGAEYREAVVMIENTIKKLRPDIPHDFVDESKFLSPPVYVASFFENNDLLVEKGADFSLGLSRDQISSLHFTHTFADPVTVMRCRYSEEDKIKFVKENILHFMDGSFSDSKTRHATNREILKYAPLFKDEKFEHEHEYVIIAYNNYGIDPVTVIRGEDVVPPAKHHFKLFERLESNTKVPYIRLPLVTQIEDTLTFDKLIIR